MRVWIVQIVYHSEDSLDRRIGPEIEAYRRAKDADARIKAIMRKAKQEGDTGTRAAAYPVAVIG